MHRLGACYCPVQPILCPAVHEETSKHCTKYQQRLTASSIGLEHHYRFSGIQQTQHPRSTPLSRTQSLGASQHRATLRQRELFVLLDYKHESRHSTAQSGLVVELHLQAIWNPQNPVGAANHHQVQHACSNHHAVLQDFGALFAEGLVVLPSVTLRGFYGIWKCR